MTATKLLGNLTKKQLNWNRVRLRNSVSNNRFDHLDLITDDKYSNTYDYSKYLNHSGIFHTDRYGWHIHELFRSMIMAEKTNDIFGVWLINLRQLNDNLISQLQQQLYLHGDIWNMFQPEIVIKPAVILIDINFNKYNTLNDSELKIYKSFTDYLQNQTNTNNGPLFIICDK